MDILPILFLAMAIDLALGEPPRSIHPVVWMGKIISILEKGNISRRPWIQFVYGCVMTLTTIALFAIPAYFLFLYLKNFNFVAHVIIGAVFLKSTFSVKELRRAALEIKELLLKDKLVEARFELRALVSRDTRDLPKPLLVSAAVESATESTCDSFIAPLFYFLLLGVPGAIGYRVVNTMDAMIGYHGEYEYLGKFAARLDDVLNFIPARLAALLLVIAAYLAKSNGSRAWKVMRGDHSKTESPNAGWTMSAAAGALNVQLEKVGYYKLGQANAHLVPETIDVALKLALIAMLSWAGICLIVGAVRFVFTT